MPIFDSQFPKNRDNNGFETIAADSGSWKPLTSGFARTSSAAIICNTSTTENLYYQLSGGSPEGSEKGIIVKPTETAFLWATDLLEGLRLRSSGAGIDVTVQYFSANISL